MTDEQHDSPMTDAQAQASNQRTDMRHKVYVHVVAVAGDEVDRKAISGNLSRKGLFVATPHIPPMGTEVKVQFRLPNEKVPIVARAKVAWINEEKDFDSGKVPGYGVEFVELADEHQEMLDSYMDHFDDSDTNHA